ncbi:MAG: hypothetical protein ACREDF_06700, partial [Thermoplasmata archaeon]
MSRDVEEVMRALWLERRRNPDPDPVSPATRVQQMVTALEKNGKLTEKELVELALRNGVPPHKIYDFVDEMASWV